MGKLRKISLVFLSFPDLQQDLSIHKLWLVPFAVMFLFFPHILPEVAITDLRYNYQKVLLVAMAPSVDNMVTADTCFD